MTARPAGHLHATSLMSRKAVRSILKKKKVTWIDQVMAPPLPPPNWESLWRKIWKQKQRTDQRQEKKRLKLEKRRLAKEKEKTLERKEESQEKEKTLEREEETTRKSMRSKPIDLQPLLLTEAAGRKLVNYKLDPRRKGTREQTLKPLRAPQCLHPVLPRRTSVTPVVYCSDMFAEDLNDMVLGTERSPRTRASRANKIPRSSGDSH